MSDTQVNPPETSFQIYNDETWLQGALLSSIAFGIVFCLSCICVQHLVPDLKRSATRKRSVFLLGYTSVVFVLALLTQASNSKFTQLAFAQNHDYPGGPSAYEQNMFFIPVDTIGNAAFAIANWLADSLIVWRCTIIYRECGLPIWLVMFIPYATLLASFIMGIFWLIQVSHVAWGVGGVQFTIPYLSLSLALNISLTLAIVSRLLYHRYRLVKVLGVGHGHQYASIASMIIESAAVYSAFSLLIIIPLGLNNPLSQIFLQPLGQVQIATSLLIIYRVASGKGFTPGMTSMSANGSRNATSSVGNTTVMQFKSNFFSSTGSQGATLAQSDIELGDQVKTIQIYAESDKEVRAL